MKEKELIELWPIKDGLVTVGCPEAVKADREYFKGKKVDVIWLDEEVTDEDIINFLTRQQEEPVTKNPEFIQENVVTSVKLKTYEEAFLLESLYYNSMLIKKFVDQQEIWPINGNGKIERNVLLREFEKYCYDNKFMGCSLKREEIIERIKDEYYQRSETNLTKQEFFENLKPNKFKYKW